MPESELNNANPDPGLDGNPPPGANDSPSWRETLPDDLKTEKTLEKFKDIPGLAKTYIELEKDASRLRNAKGVIVPGEKSKPEEWDAYYKALGRPDTPDGYELTAPELPEGMTYDEARTKAFAAIAHKEGMTAKQLKALHSAFNDMAKAEFEAQTKAVTEFREKSTAALKTKWGKDYDANLAQADAGIDRIFGPEFKKMLVDTGLKDHPAMIEGILKATQSIGEHALVNGNPRAGEGPLNRGELRKMMNDIRYYGGTAQGDRDYIKTVEKYAADLAAQEGGAQAA